MFSKVIPYLSGEFLLVGCATCRAIKNDRNKMPPKMGAQGCTRVKVAKDLNGVPPDALQKKAQEKDRR